MSLVCPYCSEPAALVTGAEVYPHRTDLSHKFFWQCAPCGAYVGTHKDSADHAPLGRLANAELRHWKMAAHTAFDPLWRPYTHGGVRRKDAYAWLAEALEMEVRDCHIGMFDVAQCKRVVEACKTKKIDV